MLADCWFDGTNDLIVDNIRMNNITITSFYFCFVFRAVVTLAQPHGTVETKTGKIAQVACLSFYSFVGASVGAFAICVHFTHNVEMSYNIFANGKKVIAKM